MVEYLGSLSLYNLKSVQWRILSAFLFLAALAPAYPPGPQVLTFFSEVDDSDQPYAFYLPRNYDPAKAWPLVISLHGAFSNHRLNLRRVFGLGNRNGESDAEATRYFPALPDVPFLVASPYARGTMGYRAFAEGDVWGVLEDVKRRFNVDPDRVYLTGLSMGGGGTLEIALSRPGVFAAIAPVCPVPPWFGFSRAGNALNLPVYLHHGDKDPVVPVSVSRGWFERLKHIGAPAEYAEYPGLLHNSWDNAYANARIFEWFAKHTRNPFPRRVRFTTDTYRYDCAYWLRITRLAPGRDAQADAVMVGPNEVNLLTEGVDGIAFDLKGHPLYDAAKPLLIRVDGVELSLPAGVPLAIRRTQPGRWETGAGEPAAGEKEAGFEGPILAAFSGRHVYVFGSADQPSREEVQRRMTEAYRASDWSTPNTRLSYAPRVLADRQLRESDLKQSSVILFGDAATNSQVAAFQSRSPLYLKPGVKDYGLIYVLPGEEAGRYAVINSGIPVTAPGAAPPAGIAALFPPVLRIAMLSADWILYKDHPGNIVASGRFDNQWQLTTEDKQKLRATGTVEVQ
jgi:fermentation-respiration switch protein FrsA (DUF1100 family)